MPRSPDLAIFMLTTDNDRQQRQTKPIALPLAHARGVIIITPLYTIHFMIDNDMI